MPAAILSKEEVVERLETVFREQGYGGASLKLLSEATGLGRSSLYHYFPRGKEDMAACVLARANQWVAENVIGALHDPGKPETRLKNAGRKLIEFYDDGNKSCLLELFALGEAKHYFGTTVREALFGIQQAFETIMLEARIRPALARQRAEDAIISIQGSLVLSRSTGSNASFQRTVKSLPKRFFQPDNRIS